VHTQVPPWLPSERPQPLIAPPFLRVGAFPGGLGEIAVLLTARWVRRMTFKSVGVLVCGFALTPVLAAPPMNQGNRFKPLTFAELSPKQQGLVTSGGVNATPTPPHDVEVSNTSPLTYVLIRSPDLAENLFKVGGYLRSSLPRKLSEIAILLTARHWTAQPIWWVHVNQYAQQYGVSRDIMDAIAAGRRPASMQPDETAVYDFCTELRGTGQVSDGTFQALKEVLDGEKGVIELLAFMGFYDTSAMMTLVSRYPLPQGVEPPLKPLSSFPHAPFVGQPTTTKMTLPLGAVLAAGETPEVRKVSLHDVKTYSPDLDDSLSNILAYLHGSLPRTLSEIAVLLTARHWNSQYIWRSHINQYAQQYGVRRDIIDAIAAGRRPASMRPDEAAVYDFCTELRGTGQVSDDTFQALKDALGGEKGVIDLIAFMGFSDTNAMMTLVSRNPLPQGVKPPLKPLSSTQSASFAIKEPTPGEKVSHFSHGSAEWAVAYFVYHHAIVTGCPNIWLRRTQVRRAEKAST
jgi:4-carboxymuconolactone decarboxylase